MRAAEIAQPNLLRTLMVYPIMYELLPSQERVGIKTGSQGAATFTGVPPKKGKYRWEVHVGSTGRGCTCGPYSGCTCGQYRVLSNKKGKHSASTPLVMQLRSLASLQ